MSHYSRRSDPVSAWRIMHSAAEKKLGQLRKKLEGDPGDMYTLHKLADLLAKEGRQDEAIAAYQRAAEIFSRKGFPKNAATIYKQILALDADLPDAKLRLAGEYQTLGLKGDAEALLLQLADHYRSRKMSAELDAVMLRLSDLHPRQVPQRPASAEAAAAPVARPPRLEAPEPLVEQARSWLETGDPARALGRLQEAKRKSPYNPEVLKLLSQVYTRLGMPAKAMAALRELARLSPKKPHAKAFPEIADPPDLVEPASARSPTDLEVTVRAGYPPPLSPVEDVRGAVTPGMVTPQPGAAGARITVDERLRDGISEADFFINQRLYPDALEILQELSSRYGPHPLVEARFDLIEDHLPRQRPGAKEPAHH
jgi:tetratricopeptide (TPR) repeat protein